MSKTHTNTGHRNNKAGPHSKTDYRAGELRDVHPLRCCLLPHLTRTSTTTLDPVTHVAALGMFLLSKAKKSHHRQFSFALKRNLAREWVPSRAGGVAFRYAWGPLHILEKVGQFATFAHSNTAQLS